MKKADCITSIAIKREHNLTEAERENLMRDLSRANPDMDIIEETIGDKVSLHWKSRKAAKSAKAGYESDGKLMLDSLVRTYLCITKGPGKAELIKSLEESETFGPIARYIRKWQKLKNETISALKPDDKKTRKTSATNMSNANRHMKQLVMERFVAKRLEDHLKMTQMENLTRTALRPIAENFFQETFKETMPDKSFERIRGLLPVGMVDRENRASKKR